MTRFEELPAAIIGKIGEAAAAEVMREDGASTIAMCRIDDGGAPMLEGRTRRDRHVLPDLQVFNWRQPGVRFIEIKTYAHAAENKRHTCWVHGIPVRLFNHYVDNENVTGVPVHLAINEIDSGELRISDVPLSQLPKLPCQCRGRCNSTDATRHVPIERGIQEMQWYFDREDFAIVYKHSSKTIERLRREHGRLIGHTKQRHGTERRPAKRPPRLLPENHPRDTCMDCGATAGANFTVTGGLFVAFTVADFHGDERVICGACWRAFYREGEVS